MLANWGQRFKKTLNEGRTSGAGSVIGGRVFIFFGVSTPTWGGLGRGASFLGLSPDWVPLLPVLLAHPAWRLAARQRPSCPALRPPPRRHGQGELRITPAREPKNEDLTPGARVRWGRGRLLGRLHKTRWIRPRCAAVTPRTKTDPKDPRNCAVRFDGRLVKDSLNVE